MAGWMMDSTGSSHHNLPAPSIVVFPSPPSPLLFPIHHFFRLDSNLCKIIFFLRMNNISSSTLEHILALTKSSGMEEEALGSNDGGEAVEMAAKTLCALSEGIERDNIEEEAENESSGKAASESAVTTEGGGIGEAEPRTIEESEQQKCPSPSSSMEQQKEEEKSSFSLEQPICIRVHMSPPKSAAPSAADEKIYKDANFASFTEFEVAFEEWKFLYHHPFRVASSEKHEDRELADRFKYRYVVYHCSRYGEPRRRGQGRRPHQNYLPCGCNAKLRLNFHAQNAGSLCVTTLVSLSVTNENVTEHNHEPMGDEGIGGPLMKRRKSSPEEDGESGGEHSPNSTASSSFFVAAPLTHTAPRSSSSAFSPLSLQPGLHNSPSSGGQSSSEGATEAIGLGLGALAGLLSPQQRTAAAIGNFGGPRQQQQQGHPLVSPMAKKAPKQEVSSSSHYHQAAIDQKPSAMTTTPLMRQQSAALDHFLRSSRHAAEQQQTMSPLVPIIQELLRATGGQQQQQGTANGMAAGGGGRPANQLLLGLLSPQQTPIPPSRPPQHPVANNGASILSAALHHHHQLQQQNPPSSSSISSASSSSAPLHQHPPNSLPNLFHANTNPSSALAMLQLQLLINSAQQQSSNHHHQQQQPKLEQQSPVTLGGGPAVIAQQQLLQMLAGGGQQQRGSLLFGNNPQRRGGPFGGGESTESPMGGRNDIIQEADLLLQMLVSQMIRTRDLALYLRRLRQFLSSEHSD